MLSHANKGLAFRIDFGCCEDSSDAGRALRRFDTKRDEAGMRVRAAYKARM
jgi:hypothetical protein